MARLGHVSLYVDRLGYGVSDTPDGNQTCIGSNADVAHQLVADARTGRYTIHGRAPVAFKKVVLASHTSSGMIVETEAYSYHDVDGLIVIGWANSGVTPPANRWALEGGTSCAQGGRPRRPGGPPNYFWFGPSNAGSRTILFKYSPTPVAWAALSARQVNPCGEIDSAASAIAMDTGRVGEIDVPVLLISGDSDYVTNPDQVVREKGLFASSPDVTAEIVKRSDHFPMLDRSAPVLRGDISRWLRTRGFVNPARAVAAHPANRAFDGRHRGPVTR
jgi:pimeloyl-ACP methyl ester carboxylesterase